MKIRVLKVDRRSDNLAELEAGISAGWTIRGWEMPK